MTTAVSPSTDIAAKPVRPCRVKPPSPGAAGGIAVVGVHLASGRVGHGEAVAGRERDAGEVHLDVRRPRVPDLLPGRTAGGAEPEVDRPLLAGGGNRGGADGGRWRFARRRRCGGDEGGRDHESGRRDDAS
ncbi:hypothetical protein GCM10010245_78070 [Streptomyces spectabilis]|nr:hypothetical protein GCM10010245_78070 [Streptomyces spectabilis]